jgi:AraC family transcriptional regulator
MMSNKITDTQVVCDSRFIQCRPVTPSLFEIEAEVASPGVLVQIQRYHWDRPVPEALFRPAVCYLDLALIRRPPPMRAALRLNGEASALTSSGDCVFMPAGSEFCVPNPHGDHRVLSCLIDPAQLDPYLDFEWTPSKLSACFDIRNHNIRDALKRLAEEAMAPGFASEFLVDMTARMLMIELARYFRGARGDECKSGGRLSARQLRLIDERVRNQSIGSPTLDELAGLCGITSRHLTRAYKNATGETLGECIANARIRQAKELLSNRDVMIKAVAYATGFKNPAAFTAAFRKATGRSPQQFRLEVLGLSA